MPEVVLYRIMWVIRASGITGNGDYCLTKEVAEEYIKSLNTMCPELDHWIEAQEP